MGIKTLALRSLGLDVLAAEPTPDDFAADVMPPARSTSTAVTVRNALSLPAAYRSVQITAGMGADLTIGAWRGDRQVPTPALLLQPDPFRSLSSWIERNIINLATDGNSFLRIHRNALGVVVALTVLNPFLTFVYRTQTGAKRYRTTLDDGTSLDLASSEVIHLWNLEVAGMDRGEGPIGWCRTSLSGALDVRDYGAGWFRSGDVPSGVLQTTSPLSPDAATEYKKQWQKDDGYSVKVIGHGLDYKPILLKPEDAQWIESQKFSVTDVARMFGVPAAYVLASVEGSSITYANLEQIDAQFLRTTLFPVYLRKIEAALTEALPRGQRARFDTSALLRPDSKTRADIAAIYLDKGVIDADEVRAAEGLPPRTPKERAA